MKKVKEAVPCRKKSKSAAEGNEATNGGEAKESTEGQSGGTEVAAAVSSGYTNEEVAADYSSYYQEKEFQGHGYQYEQGGRAEDKWANEFFGPPYDGRPTLRFSDH
ncbi:hypothetical protein Nepgr_028033 [Nepenthes gracilis]|uniref:Uncharacterized protein n=1 Tax=Nepenthes gracilis TaxID=150966 RepID=A0AAD3Y3J2_NEPGR|nr:hypothetical protein Nepgr_028033 [Nepenthes gracilis]